eukprot:TRINITY_DN2922_c0_g2_i1.p2 TRINITY_DN2922_c0_g2~~TRINITY_DN2922_c0_g2_i1.p2  ORF type:complete len:148 (-),score=41.25 TRINITY_DN2922_c0_g2_i1:139-582(-)
MIKASIHYSVAKICEDEAQNMSNADGVKGEMVISTATIASLTELVQSFAGTMASDLACFAKHAKRNTIQTEDVLLCARKTHTLESMLTKYVDELKEEKKRKKKVVGGSSSSSTAANKKTKPTLNKKTALSDEDEVPLFDEDEDDVFI